MLSYGGGAVLKESPDLLVLETRMEFRLFYEGPLRSTQRPPEGMQKDPRSNHKHDIRRVFNAQLRRLWEITPALKEGRTTGPEPITIRESNVVRSAEALSVRYALFGFKFVPLVTEELNLVCGLEVLFLRRDRPGKLWKGDIDNRVKTLLDALAIPMANDNYEGRLPAGDERPLYCVLEKDGLVTKLSVETDQLLDFKEGDDHLDDVKLVITVRIHPYELHLGNIHMGQQVARSSAFEVRAFFLTETGAPDPNPAGLRYPAVAPPPKQDIKIFPFTRAPL